MKPSLVVLAAGMGSRFGGVKQIEPVGPHGEIILDYSVFDAIRAGFGKVVFVLRKDIVDDFKAHILPRFDKKIEVSIVLQSLDKIPQAFKIPDGRTKPWGTTHAILMTEEAVKEPFTCINADDFYGADSFAVVGKYLSELQNADTKYSMVGYHLKNTVSEFGSVSRGVCRVDANGNLGDVEEHTKILKTTKGIVSQLPSGQELSLTGNEIVSMNMFGFTPHIYGDLHKEFESFLTNRGQELSSECFIPTVVNTLIHSNRASLKVLSSQSTWFGITYKEDLLSTKNSIQALVAKKEYPEDLWKHS